MKQPKVKEPVRLRSKPLKDGSESLYLDIYWNGIRQYEFLKLYLIPETTKEAKARNKEAMAIATTLKSERIVAIQRGEYNFPTADTKITLLDYIEQERQGYIDRGSKSYAQNLGSLYSHLKAFAGPNKKLASVDKRFIQKFYRLSRSLRNTRVKFFRYSGAFRQYLKSGSQIRADRQESRRNAGQGGQAQVRRKRTGIPYNRRAAAIGSRCHCQSPLCRRRKRFSFRLLHGAAVFRHFPAMLVAYRRISRRGL